MRLEPGDCRRCASVGKRRDDRCVGHAPTARRSPERSCGTEADRAQTARPGERVVLRDLRLQGVGRTCRQKVFQRLSTSLAVNDRTVAAGEDTTYTVKVTSLGGYASPVTLSATGLPKGLTAEFSQNPVVPSAHGSTSELRLKSDQTLFGGRYSVRVAGAPATAGPTPNAAAAPITSHSGFASLAVTPDYILDLSPSSVSSTTVAPGWGIEVHDCGVHRGSHPCARCRREGRVLTSSMTSGSTEFGDFASPRLIEWGSVSLRGDMAHTMRGSCDRQ